MFWVLRLERLKREHPVCDGIFPALDGLHDATGKQLSVKKPQRARAESLVARVAAPVRGGDVGPAVAVEVAGGDAVPEAGELVEG